jgi:hypothetical protein
MATCTSSVISHLEQFPDVLFAFLTYLVVDNMSMEGCGCGTLSWNLNLVKQFVSLCIRYGEAHMLHGFLRGLDRELLCSKELSLESMLEPCKENIKYLDLNLWYFHGVLGKDSKIIINWLLKVLLSKEKEASESVEKETALLPWFLDGISEMERTRFLESLSARKLSTLSEVMSPTLVPVRSLLLYSGDDGGKTCGGTTLRRFQRSLEFQHSFSRICNKIFANELHSAHHGLHGNQRRGTQIMHYTRCHICGKDLIDAKYDAAPDAVADAVVFHRSCKHVVHVNCNCGGKGTANGNISSCSFCSRNPKQVSPVQSNEAQQQLVVHNGLEWDQSRLSSNMKTISEYLGRTDQDLVRIISFIIYYV